MFFKRIITPGLAIQTYLIGDEKCRKMAIIDPVRIIAPYLEIAKDKGFEIALILETHVHADFVSGAPELKACLGGTPQIICSATGGEKWIPAYADKTVTDGQSVRMGTLTFQAVATPGHTPEHVSWLLKDQGGAEELFSGDFLFVGDVGRPDLLGEKEKKKLANELYRSIFEGLKGFSDSLKILPAHGAGSLCGKNIGKSNQTTLGHERKNNPAFQKKSKETWIRNLMQDMPPAPPYFERMKKINVRGAPILGLDLPGKQRLQNIQKGAFLLDLRPAEEFAKGHLQGAVNIPMSSQLSYWAGWIVPYERPLVLVLAEGQTPNEAIKALLLIGLDEIQGYVQGGGPETIGKIEAHQLNGFHLVDVRSELEFHSGHIEGAQHIPLGKLPKEIDKVPKDRPVAVICRAGYRSAIGASLLTKAGLDAYSVQGGMVAWEKTR